MKILIADDAEVVRLLIGRFVETLGHQVLLARDGVEALEVFRSQRPDMILMDMLMPRMDGPEAARLVKAEAGEHWIPVVLVTAVGEEDKLADAIEIGADDYLLKPVNYRILEAKITAIERTVELNRKVREQSLKLAEYYDRAEDEKRVARHLLEQMVNRERLSDPQLHYWISPAESLSGDLIAAARTPGRVLHLMLADGIGHGLTAALNVLPLTQPFYAMTERGFELPDILIEMCRKVRQVLPTGRFVALAFVAVDFSDRRIEVWNGGIPDLRLFDQQGELVKSWRSRHLPLGIVSAEDLDLTTERSVFDRRCSLVMCSDGLLEARGSSGDAFGEGRLAEACAGRPPGEALGRVIDALAAFVGDSACHDDVSLAIVDIDPHLPELPLPAGKVESAPLPDLAGEARWRYALTLGAEELRYLHTVPLLMAFVSQIKPLGNAQADIFLILTELFVNALDHGVLRLSSSLKSEPDGMERYLLERARRLASLQQGRVEIELLGYEVGGRPMLRVRVSDSGEGFEWRTLAQPSPTQPSGRGIAIVRALCASLHFFGNGNSVEAFYLPRVD
ncbi:ATP-binding SpoIIE family protein phosphatase [Chitinimonas lacunae]|uniref:SpoIIE family protein phosphatase n=1 Tax=Chitinimonas lacunae TaxID=1963018 RepID=A0ABV8MWF0_9NEIS